MQAMTKEDMEQVKQSFVRAAKMAVQVRKSRRAGRTQGPRPLSASGPMLDLMHVPNWFAPHGVRAPTPVRANLLQHLIFYNRVWPPGRRV